ncbi:MAG: hypothetical protein F9K44_16925 [Hyphomicrobiaceae bacterium]|nr:MAG: hypothetical protein F9K44_16925 [Hyphomicrobiaceae bacterium]
MPPVRFLAPLLVILAAACSTAQQAPRGAPELGVEFTWTGVPPCSAVSPRIVVRDVPPGTRRFRVELVDVDSVMSRHGGGEVEAVAGGVIPAGALKSYRGPCPSQKAIEYEMRVAALDAAGRVIAEGKERQSYVPTQLRRPSRSGQR